MNKKASGDRWEKRIQEYLISLGFKTDRAKRQIRMVGPGKWFSTPYDFLGVADIIAVHKDKPYTLFVQATTADPNCKKEKMEKMGWNLNAQKVQIWTKFRSIQSGCRILNLKNKSTWEEHIFRIKDGINLMGDIL